MSCNIIHQRKLKLDGFKIKLEDLYMPKKGYESWVPDKPEMEDISKNLFSISGGCGQVIKGYISDGWMEVIDLELYGESSATFFQEIFLESLKSSLGTLSVWLIWETGKIEKVTINNGEITRKDLELED